MSRRRALAIATASIAVSTCAIGLLMSGCVYLVRRSPSGLCEADRGSPIPGFCVVASGTLWEGKRPSAADAQWLLTHGVGSIVSIQVHDSAAFRASKVPPEMSVVVPEYRIGRFNAVRLLNRADLDERVALFLAILREAPKPVYLNCHFGVDRALLLAAAYKILIQGLDAEQAIKDLRSLHSPWLPPEVKYLRSLSDRKREILQQVTYWAPRVRANAEIRCTLGRCLYLRTDGKGSQELTKAMD